MYSSSQHQVWSHQATFNSVKMTRPPKGGGSQYITATKDSDGQWLNGSIHYIMTIPANVPASNIWSVILYDAHFRSMTKNEEFRWGLKSYEEGIKKEADGSRILHFSPKKSKAVEQNNWIQTNSHEGYFVWFRVYGPQEPWDDNSWILPDIEKHH